MSISSLDILNLSHALKDVCEVNCNTSECLSQTLRVLLQCNLITANVIFSKQLECECCKQSECECCKQSDKRQCEYRISDGQLAKKEFSESPLSEHTVFEHDKRKECCEDV